MSQHFAAAGKRPALPVDGRSGHAHSPRLTDGASLNETPGSREASGALTVYGPSSGSLGLDKEAVGPSVGFGAGLWAERCPQTADPAGAPRAEPPPPRRWWLCLLGTLRSRQLSAAPGLQGSLAVMMSGNKFTTCEVINFPTHEVIKQDRPGPF
ncbi:uncharacterized protein [Patagioenas fasciata]|uniref:uncharacterized protein isoform X2 n=1 Tax=Patagioenas fasciata TaxID=372321 RepID=UPI003A99C08D